MCFVSKKLADGIVMIEDYSVTKMYLIEGNNSAVLIDTGVGFWGLSEYIQALTVLPLTVLITHGHFDHAGGIRQWDRVYMNHRDLPMLVNNDRKTRLEYARGMCGKYCPPEKLSISDFQDSQTDPMIMDIRDGQEFDLGGRKLTAIFAPGHTQGTMVFYDDLSRSLFLGDACNPSTYLFLEDGLPVERYLESVRKLEGWASKTEHCYFQHDYGTITCEGPVSIISEVRECCEQILEKKDESVPFSRGIVEGMITGRPVSAHTLGDNLMRLDGLLGNVIYAPARVYKSMEKGGNSYVTD